MKDLGRSAQISSIRRVSKGKWEIWEDVVRSCQIVDFQRENEGSEQICSNPARLSNVKQFKGKMKDLSRSAQISPNRRFSAGKQRIWAGLLRSRQIVDVQAFQWENERSEQIWSDLGKPSIFSGKMKDLGRSAQIWPDCRISSNSKGKLRIWVDLLRSRQNVDFQRKSKGSEQIC